MNKTRKQLEFELNVFRSSPDWEYIESPGGEILHVSPAVEEITGYTQEEFVSDKNLIAKLVHSDDHDRYISHLVRSYELQPNEPHTPIEFRIARKDGSIRYISHNCIMVYAAGEDGEAVYCGKKIVNRDISNVRKIEIERDGAIRQNKVRDWLLRECIEGLDFGILVCDKSLNVLMVNSKYVRIFRVPDDIIKTKDAGENVKWIAQNVKNPAKYHKDIDAGLHATKETTQIIEMNDGRKIKRTLKPLENKGYLARVEEI